MSVIGFRGLVGTFLVGLAFAPSAARALDCGTHLVTRGDHSVYVRSVCGEPAAVTARTETRWVQAWNNPRFRMPGFTAGQAVTVTIEVWVYDFGPQRYMEELTFEAGVITATRHLGRGTNNGHSPSASLTRLRNESPLVRGARERVGILVPLRRWVACLGAKDDRAIALV